MFSSATSARRPASMIGVLATHRRRPPVAEQQGLGVVGVVADGDAPVLEVGVQGVGGVAVPELAQRLDLPFVLLAAVVAQLDGRLPLGQGGEQAAGGDLRELPAGRRRARPWRRCRCTSSRSRARSRVPAVPASSTTSTVRGVEAARFAVGRSRSGDGRSSSTGCRPPSPARRRRRRCAPRRSPGSRALPSVACCCEGERLAGAGRCGEDVDAVAGRGHLDHRRHLFVGQASAARSRAAMTSCSHQHGTSGAEQRASRVEGAVVRCRAARTSSTAPALAASRSSAPSASRITAPLPGTMLVQRRGLEAVDQQLGSSSIRSIGAPAGRASHHARRMSLPVERRVVGGQPVGAEHPVLDGSPLRVGDRDGSDAADARRRAVAGRSRSLRARFRPSGAQLGDAEVDPPCGGGCRARRSSPPWASAGCGSPCAPRSRRDGSRTP